MALNGITTPDDERRVIVIGSGPSGATAALSLLRRGIPVTMLESGESFRRGLVLRLAGVNAYRHWASYAAPTPYGAPADPDTRWYQDLSPGGLSNHWTGAVPRFAPEDFSEGARLDESYRWPVTYPELQPYYERVEPLLGIVADPRPVPMLQLPNIRYRRRFPRDWSRLVDAAASRGQGLSLVPLADGPPWLLRRSGAAFNSFTQIVQKLRQLPHFKLRLGAHAQQLEWRGDRQCVDSVVYVDRATRRQHRLRAAAVVVAAGPLASTKLLLNSQSADFPEGLGNTEGVLGCYLHDHPKDWCTVHLDRPLSRLGHPIIVTRAPYADSPPLLAASCTLGALSKIDRLLCFTPIGTDTFGLQTFGTMIPSTRNYVRLSSQIRDEFGLPSLDIQLRYDDEVHANVQRTHERLSAIFEAAGHPCTVKCTLPKPLPPGESVHYGGTVRMHSSPRFGMLDGWNRMHAVDNVVVADASAFTTGPEKNPTLTAMALAARAMDKLADDLKVGLSRKRTNIFPCSTGASVLPT